jgi:hypothetical protein
VGERSSPLQNRPAGGTIIIVGGPIIAGGRTQFAPTLWTKSVTVGAQSLRPPSDWDIIPTQVPNANGSEAQTHFNRLSLRLVESPQPPRHRGVLPLAPSQLTI